MKLIKIIYVGRKPVSHDNVARSGKVWNENGDIQEVTDEQAKILLKYPDQWALVPADVDQDNDSDDNNQNDDDIIDQDNDSLKVHLEKMTKPELIQYAKEKFQKELLESLT